MDNNTTEGEAFEESLVDLEVNYVDTCLLNANQQCHCQKVNCRFIIKIVVINCCWGLSGNLAMYAGAHVVRQNFAQYNLRTRIIVNINSKSIILRKIRREEKRS